MTDAIRKFRLVVTAEMARFAGGAGSGNDHVVISTQGGVGMLKLAVTGDDDRAVQAVVARLHELAAAGEHTHVAVAHPAVPDPGAHHLVVGVTLQPQTKSPTISVWTYGCPARLTD